MKAWVYDENVGLRDEILYLYTLDLEGNKKFAPYWYLLHRGAFSYKAFVHRASLLRWLEERGLTLSEPLPEHGSSRQLKVVGTFREVAHSDAHSFSLIQGSETRQLNNGDYTKAIITTDGDGVNTVHYMHPSNDSRIVYDYRESAAMLG